MTIKAYTFEAQNNTGQISPYSAKVDARIRRDLFNGAGNLIFTGDRNGYITDREYFGNIGDEIRIAISNAVSFMAGGRLFSVTNQWVTIETNTTADPTIGTAQLIFNIDTTAADGLFVKMETEPKYEQVPEAWESDKFSAVFDLVVVKVGVDGLQFLPAIKHNAQINAGSSFNISKNGTLMNGRDATWRGRLTTYGNLYLAQCATKFTLSGTTGEVVITTEQQNDGTQADVLKFAKQEKAPHGLSISNGKATLWAPGWIVMGDIVENTAGNFSGYNFKMENLKTITGNKPKNIENAGILANFEAKWVEV